MKINTIMNYPDLDNFNIMSIAFIGQALKHSNCKIEIFTEKELPSSVCNFIKKYGKDRVIVSFKSRKDISHLNIDKAFLKKAAHNVGFKLYNLCNEKEPFIFIDADAFVLNDIDILIECSKDKPFIAVDHQNVQGHTSHIPHRFINSGMQIVSDPSILKYDKITERYEIDNGFIVPGTDQAMLFSYFKSIDYDYTHKKIGFEWNSCAGFTRYNRDLTAKCVGLDNSHPVYLNHYWYKYKPWTVNCPIYKIYKKVYNENYGEKVAKFLNSKHWEPNLNE